MVTSYLSLLDFIPSFDEVLSKIKDYRTTEGHMNLVTHFRDRVIISWLLLTSCHGMRGVSVMLTPLLT